MLSSYNPPGKTILFGSVPRPAQAGMGKPYVEQGYNQNAESYMSLLIDYLETFTGNKWSRMKTYDILRYC
ncbi:hypothetical protein MASR2M78_21020 [Treponema sp.]